MAQELHRVLQTGEILRYFDWRYTAQRMYQSLAYQTIDNSLNRFKLKEDIIKAQYNCNATPYWKSLSKKHNFHLIMHEHLFVFKK